MSSAPWHGRWRWFFRHRRAVRLWGPVFAIALVSAIVALLVWNLKREGTPAERAEHVAEIGQLDTAEKLYWQLVQAKPADLDAWIGFIDTHAALRRSAAEEGGALPDETLKPSVSEPAIRQLLGRVPDAHAKTLATYWYEAQSPEGKPDLAAVTALADAKPPARLANFLLARAALEDDRWAVAAARFEAEGLAFPKEGKGRLSHALALWVKHDAWNEVRKRSHDPRYAAVWDARLRYELATHDRDWVGILLWLWPASYVHTEAWPIALAILAAVLWFTIAARLGRIQDPVPGRRLLYALSFVLGVLSIYPTLLIITIEEGIFALRELGQPIPDAIYFVFGVGLREELGKLLLFLPLLPTLKRRGSRLEAMTCGALVGLGFAAEENVSYFHMMPPGAALARFLTANFLHMSLTALVALAVYDTARGRATERDAFNVTFPLMVFIHGAYDFFLSSGSLAIAAMALFVVISQRFLRQLLIASSKLEEESALRLLVWAMALLTGVSYVYATTLVGPAIALALIGLGFIGVAIVVYMFVRELT